MINDKMNIKHNPLIVGFGCALIDLIVSTETKNLELTFLSDNELEQKDKYSLLIDKLKLINDRNDISSINSISFLKEIIRNNIDKIQLGGCTTNSLRLFNYLIESLSQTVYKFNKNDVYKSYDSSAVFICSIGDDSISNMYKSKLQYDSVFLLDNIVNDSSVSFCIPLIIDKERIFFNELETTKKITKKFMYEVLEKVIANNSLNKDNVFDFSNCKYFITDSYLVESCFDEYKILLEGISKTSMKIVFNIGDSYFYERNFDNINFLIKKYSDIVIMNYDELLAVKNKLKKLTNNNELSNNTLLDHKNSSDEIDFFSELGKEQYLGVNEKNNKRIFISTHGNNETWMLESILDKQMSKIENNIYKSKPNNIPKEEIVDFNGAGDSFTAGFLVSVFLLEKILLEDKKMESQNNDATVKREKYDFIYSKSLEFGNFCAECVIRYSGFQIPLNHIKEIVLKFMTYVEQLSKIN